jgi:hypothetical protein
VSDRALLLERLLSGEIGASDPAAQRLFERDPSAREEYEALRALELSLERQGDRTRVLIEVAGGPQVPGSETGIRRKLEQLSGTPTKSFTATRRKWLRWAATCAAATLLVLVWMRGSDDPPTQEELKLSDSQSSGVQAIEPRGQVAAYAPFRWSGALQTGGWFQVEAYDDSAPPGSEPFLSSGALLENQWIPPVPPSTWPRAIRWTVLHFDSSGHGRRSDWFSASLSP